MYVTFVSRLVLNLGQIIRKRVSCVEFYMTLLKELILKVRMGFKGGEL